MNEHSKRDSAAMKPLWQHLLTEFLERLIPLADADRDPESNTEGSRIKQGSRSQAHKKPDEKDLGPEERG